MTKKVIFSGIQPTGNLHIGNYLGAIKNWIALQNSGEYECFFSIVDYHSLVGNMSPAERKRQTIVLAAELLSLGIDPNKSTFFVQSHISEHTELAWIFTSVTPVKELERMTQFKDKSLLQTKNINTGLFTYPILQAADILLYHGTHVPVGEDQVQHVELTRNIAKWFNGRYGQYFSETQAMLTKTPRVKSLLDPKSKMSKSKGEGHVIELADEPSTIEKKIKKAVTASEGGDKAPGVENLLLLLKEFGDRKMHEQFVAQEKDGSIQYGALKKEVTESTSAYFAAFRKQREALFSEENKIEKILSDGAKKAKAVAEKTMTEVRERVGVR